MAHVQTVAMDQTNENTFKVDQMLHGYSNGHKLLAYSCKLSQPSLRYARMMSDLSGPSFKSGFDGYLSGYPLKDDGYFALAKTWFAKELPRPGCVWTHTLLLPLEKLGDFDAFVEALELFQRPHSDDLMGYSDCLTLPQIGKGFGKFNTSATCLLKELLFNYYSFPDKIIISSAISSSEHEDVVLRLWRQQWPSLRSQFSFCTGSLDVRDGETRIDIQIIPNERQLWKKASTKESIVLLDEADNNSDEKPWITPALIDAIESHNGPFFRFIKEFTSDKTSRKDFKKFSLCFVALHDENNLPKTIQFICDQFPEPRDVVALKIAVAGAKGERTYFLRDSDNDILQIVLKKSVWPSIDKSSLKVADRIRSIWSHDQGAIFDLLIQTKHHGTNDSIGYLLDTVAELASPKSLSRAINRDVSLAIEIIRRQPALAATSEIWKNQSISFSVLGNTLLEHFQTDDVLLKQTLTCLIAENRKDAEGELSQFLGASLVPIILSLNPSDLRLIDSTCSPAKNTLSKNPDSCISWLRGKRKASPESAVMATLGIKTNSIGLDQAFMAAWAQSMTNYPKVTEQTIHHSYATMLSLAFDRPQMLEAELIARICFPHIYYFAKHNLISYEHWDLVEKHLPDSGFWWDKCKKLRLGLLQRCVDNSWEIETFVKCTSKDASLAEVLDAWGLSYREKNYLKSTINSILSHTVSASEEQVRVAEKSKFWF